MFKLGDRGVIVWNVLRLLEYTAGNKLERNIIAVKN